MTDLPLVVVRTFADRIEAEIAQSALEAAGINVRERVEHGLAPDVADHHDAVA